MRLRNAYGFAVACAACVVEACGGSSPAGSSPPAADGGSIDGTSPGDDAGRGGDATGPNPDAGEPDAGRPSPTANGWSDRCAGVNVPGGASSVISCQSFDTFPAINGQQYFQLYDPGSITTDCQIAADGCSLKFAILNGYFQGEPGWFSYNFSADLSRTFGEGQEFYVQYRERIDPARLVGANFSNGEGMKMDIVSPGDTAASQQDDCSNNPGDIVTIQDGPGNQYPALYHNCGYSGGPYAFMQSPYQLIQLGGIVNTNFLDQVYSGCPHYTGRGTPSTDPTCWNYTGNEWLTVQKHVRVGKFNQPTSTLEVWFAHEGSPSVLTTGASDAALVDDGTGTSTYGKVTLLPYDTGATSKVDTAVWYDDLIVSTRRIPDPSVGVPNAPDNLSATVATGKVTVSWRVNSQNGRPEDDRGFSVERCKGASTDCFPNPQSGFVAIGTTAAGASSYVDTTVAAGTAYVYRVSATNLAGKSAYAAALCFNGGSTCGGSVVAQ
jgi:hypothetical protein